MFPRSKLSVNHEGHKRLGGHTEGITCDIVKKSTFDKSFYFFLASHMPTKVLRLLATLGKSPC
ncbi:hypothetical protein MPLDJ20_60014 [Mesorhizobium plurifarium]|uniref:Uncharacterized protein n=1 Tax=Mesorhizobium plurifarium TaxID=69974 RepID=A0A090FMH1_MESPL|nr:hypothetical protein MPLDJ20_60014 [Mesorhizobium plurifarium]